MLHMTGSGRTVLRSKSVPNGASPTSSSTSTSTSSAIPDDVNGLSAVHMLSGQNSSEVSSGPIPTSSNRAYNVTNTTIPQHNNNNNSSNRDVGGAASRSSALLEYDRLGEVRTAVLRQLNQLGRRYAETGVRDIKKLKQLEETLKAVDARRGVLTDSLHHQRLHHHDGDNNSNSSSSHTTGFAAAPPPGAGSGGGAATRRSSANSSLLSAPETFSAAAAGEAAGRSSSEGAANALRRASGEYMQQQAAAAAAARTTRPSRPVMGKERPASAPEAARAAATASPNPSTSSSGPAAMHYPYDASAVRVAVRRLVRPSSASIARPSNAGCASPKQQQQQQTTTTTSSPEPPARRTVLRVRRDLQMSRQLHAEVGGSGVSGLKATPNAKRSPRRSSSPAMCAASLGATPHRAWENVSSASSVMSASPCNSMPGTPTSSAGGHAFDAGALMVLRLKEKGNEHFRQEEYRKAAEAYTDALRLDPLSEVLSCNRAAAYLLSGHYAAAFVECKYVLLRNPNHMKANWRAGKALLYLNRLADARRFYRNALQAADDTIGTSADNNNNNNTSATSASASSNAVHAGGRHHAQHVKMLREKNAVVIEGGALELVDKYWQHMRSEQWSEAVDCTERLMLVFGSTGPSSLPWWMRQVEALLNVDPPKALERVQEKRRECASAASHSSDVYYVHAKALFLCSHDAPSTRQCLELLDEGAKRLGEQNKMLETNVRQYAQWLRTCRSRDTVDVEAWLADHRLMEDSRSLQLRATITEFERYRDEGNNAYAAANWHAAFQAYTQCLTVDTRNQSLMGTTYCNRSAVCMQAGRWKEALSDAHEAIKFVPTNAKAYGRRARIYLHFFQQLQYSPYAAAGTAERHIRAAMEDLKQAQSIAPSADTQKQLERATAQWQMFVQRSSKSGSPPSPPFRRQSAGGAGGASTSSCGGGFERRSSDNANGGSSSYNNYFYQHSQQQQRRAHTAGGGGASSSSSTSRVGTAAGKREAYLKLLGLPSGGTPSSLKVEQAALTKAYRGAALRWHPDKWVNATAQEREDAEKHFKEINIAYQSLKDGN